MFKKILLVQDNFNILIDITYEQSSFNIKILYKTIYKTSICRVSLFVYLSIIKWKSSLI